MSHSNCNEPERNPNLFARLRSSATCYDDFAINLHNHTLGRTVAKLEVARYLALSPEFAIRRAIGVVARQRKVTVIEVPESSRVAHYHDFSIGLESNGMTGVDFFRRSP